MSLVSRSLAACALAAVAAGCNQESAVPHVVAAPALVEVPIGPWPGVAEPELAEAAPFAGDHQALGEGRRFFMAYNCAGCHGDHGGGGMGPSLRDEVWLYGSSPGRIASSIAQGRAFGMPAWRKMLTDAQIWQITAYLKSMRTPDEPEPPLP